MGWITQSRRRMIANRAVQLTLTRPDGTSQGAGNKAISLIGALVPFSTEEMLGGVVQGDVNVFINNEELAASTLGRPRKGDRIRSLPDNQTYVVQAAEAAIDEGKVIGFKLWARGA